MSTDSNVGHFLRALDDLADPTSDVELARILAAYDRLGSTPCGAASAEAILYTFQRFPDSDGFDIYDTLRLYLETCDVLDIVLLRSLQARPTEMATVTLVRIYNAGQRSLGGVDIATLMRSIAERDDSAGAARVASRFLDRHGG